MSLSKRKAELLASIEQLSTLAHICANDTNDETSRLRDIFNATQHIAYLSQTPIDWAQRILTQPALTCAIRVAIEAQWFSILEDGEAKTATEIASVTGTSRELLIRLFRILTCEGLVNEVGIATYSANEKTRYWMVPVHQDMAKTWFDNVSVPSVNLPTYLSTTNFREPSDDTLGPYAFTYDTTSWKRFQQYPAVGSSFNKAMTVVKRHDRCPLVEKYPLVQRLIANDVLPQSDEEVLIVDVGGGLGYHLRQFCEDLGESRPRGRLILQDLPHVLPSPEHEPEVYVELQKHNIETMAYGFFTPQPIHGAQTYTLSSILHSHPHPRAHQILLSLLPALHPYPRSRLLIHDYILPDTGASTMQAGFDFTMMVVLCGRERSLREWRGLVGGFGLSVMGVFGDWGKGAGTGWVECGLMDGERGQGGWGGGRAGGGC